MKINNDIFATKALFFIMAFSIGLWTIRIPTIRDQIQTDYLGIGYIMAIFAIGSILAMLFANYIILRISSKNILIYISLAQWIFWLPVPFIKDLETFVFLAFLFGICFGLFEICINLQASKAPAMCPALYSLLSRISRMTAPSRLTSVTKLEVLIAAPPCLPSLTKNANSKNTNTPTRMK